MAPWRFYQGLRTEWHWYHLDDRANVIAEADRGFAELRACMANAETAGFTGDAYHVQVRQAGNFAAGVSAAHEAAQDLAAGWNRSDASDEQTAP